MEDGEGSVITDGVDAEETQNENSEVSENSTNINNSDNKPESGEGQTGEKDTVSPEDKVENGETSKPKFTEKGTKLAEDPVQQANQLRANAEAKAKEYEEFFSDPKNVEVYLNDLKGGKADKTVPEDKSQEIEISDADINKLVENVETKEDVQKAIKGIFAYANAEIQKVRGEMQGITTSTKVKETNANVATEISQVQSKYPVLQKKLSDGTDNPEFDKDLDETIGKMFLKMDFDPRTKTFKGQTSLMEVADMFMKAAKISESKGSRKAQTIIKDKRGGRVISGGTNTDNRGVDESKMSPSQTIADRIKRVGGR